MSVGEPTSFGPFILGAPLGGRESVELASATLFLADGSGHRVALRRTRRLDDGGHDAFLRTAERLSALRHPGIVGVRDLGTLEGRSYVATDLVEGHNLLRVLARCGQRRMGFPTDAALYIVQRVLAALEHAHALRDPDGHRLPLVHGDLGHTNVLLTPEGDVRVTDFGLGAFSTRQRTALGLNAGPGQRSTCYLAPEQVRGAPAAPASDVFATGVLLFELVTGRILFSDASEAALLERVASGRYTVPLERYRPDLHPTLGWLIRTALAPEPGERFASAGAFLRAIDELLLRLDARLDRFVLQHLMQRLFGAKSLEETV